MCRVDGSADVSYVCFVRMMSRENKKFVLFSCRATLKKGVCCSCFTLDLMQVTEGERKVQRAHSASRRFFVLFDLCTLLTLILKIDTRSI